MRKKIPLRHLGALCFVLVLGMASAPAEAFDIRLGAGEEGTFSNFSGRLLCRVINRQITDVSCRVVPASGDVHNLTNLQGGSLDIALIDSRVLHDAVNKTGEFQFLDIRYDNLLSLFPLYANPIALIVRRDAHVASLDELKGKRINAGPQRSPQRGAVDTIMEAKGWSADDFSLFAELPESQSQDTMAFCHGTIQAMVHIGVHPDSSLQQLFKLCKAELVSMDDKDIVKLIDTHPAFLKIEIAPQTYPPQERMVTTFGTRAMLVASESLDEETVFRIMEVIGAHRERLQRAHPALSTVSGADIDADELGFPLHPGAAKFFSGSGQ